MDQTVTLLGSRPNENGVFVFVFFALGAPLEPRLSTESLKVTLGAPKCLPKLSEIIKYLKIIKNMQNNAEYGYNCLVKKSKKCGRSALYFMCCCCSFF